VIFTLSLCIFSRNFAGLTSFSRISAKIHELLGVSTVSDISAALGVAVAACVIAVACVPANECVPYVAGAL
jgi:hypothetical protein